MSYSMGQAEPNKTKRYIVRRKNDSQEHQVYVTRYSYLAGFLELIIYLLLVIVVVVERNLQKEGKKCQIGKIIEINQIRAK